VNTPVDRVTVEEFLALMKRQLFTGATIVHWQNGRLKLVEFPSQRLTITEKRIDGVTPPAA
jgi:hypothetical protein